MIIPREIVVKQDTILKNLIFYSCFVIPQFAIGD